MSELVTIDEILKDVVEEVNFDAIQNTSSGEISIDPEIKIYRTTLTVDEGGTAVLPVPDTTRLPEDSAYFQYELEVTVPSNAVVLSFDKPSSWTWMEGGELPMLHEDFAGKILYIVARFDCHSKKTLANIWRIENAS